MLNIIKNVSEHKEGSRNGLMILSCKDYKTLLDYITNLQQDTEMYAQLKDTNEEIIKQLEENNQAMQEEMARVWEENERLKQSNKILEENWKHYMMRCGKALDYVNNTSNFRLITLQNILQNGSEEK